MSGLRRNTNSGRRSKRPGLNQDRYTDGPTDCANPDQLSGQRARRRRTGPRGGRDFNPGRLGSEYEGAADDDGFDGDVAMGDGPKSSGSTRHSPYGSRSRTRGRGAHHANQPVAVSQRLSKATDTNASLELSIKGHPAGARDDLLAFIRARSPIPLDITSERTQGNLLFVTLTTLDQAQAVAKLHNVAFMGRSLSIRYVCGASSSGKGPSPSNPVAAELTSIVRSRYNPTLKLLDLSQLETISEARRESLQLDASSQTPKFWEALFVICQKLAPDAEAMSLAANHLSSLACIASLGKLFPHLRNLSLEGNRITTFRDLDHLAKSTHPPRDLKELVLRGNPLVAIQMQQTGGDVLFVGELVKRFPKLELLDLVPIPPELRRPLPKSSAQPPTKATAGDHLKAQAALPLSATKAFFDSTPTGELCSAFLGEFFRRYDTQRSALLDWYDPNATFSVAVDTSAVTTWVTLPSPMPPAYIAAHEQRQRTRRPAPSAHVTITLRPKFNRLDWGEYTSVGRNLVRIRDRERRAAHLFQGPEAIGKVFAKLPTTVHPLEDAQRFDMSAWQVTNLPPATYPGPGGQAADMPPAITVLISGEFYEPQSNSLRSFDRTFLLVPSVPGSRAHAAACPFSIRNDLLMVRHYAGTDLWRSTTASNPCALLSLPTASPPEPTMVVQNALGQSVVINQHQNDLVGQLQSRTRLTAPFALQCLEEHGWDVERAFQGFQLALQRNAVPPNAFVPGS
ncbi:nuclear mRNA export, poly(A)+RNA binding protein [Dimargaris xerosporica]|nr:nuclear mRNA export, poly(A)+RNA binding protein [Dimargaris xerosporica]